jgi:hypothetical protein
MERHGVVEDNLKPAYLLLSACERDLGKRNTDPVASEKHYISSRRWLQKVYGLDIFQGANLPDISLGEAKQSAHGPSDLHTPLNTLSPHPRVLVGNLESHRIPQTSQDSVISETSTLKRKLTDSLAKESKERNHRIKLEGKVKDLEKEVAAWRKAEKLALQQVKTEFAARKKAEERADSEREKRIEAEKRFDLTAAKPLFKDLATLFQKAADGEGVAALNLYRCQVGAPAT